MADRAYNIGEWNDYPSFGQLPRYEYTECHLRLPEIPFGKQEHGQAYTAYISQSVSKVTISRESSWQCLPTSICALMGYGSQPYIVFLHEDARAPPHTYSVNLREQRARRRLTAHARWNAPRAPAASWNIKTVRFYLDSSMVWKSQIKQTVKSISRHEEMFQ